MSGMVSSAKRDRVNVPTKRKKRGKGPIKRHHWFHGVIIVCGWILPPIAVLIRFGVGVDFLINIFCTVAGYIPGHFHNFWIQNIRNNSNEKHSPKWAIKAGLVKDYNKSKLKKRGWTGRYEDDGVTGGASYHGQKRWEDTEVIVDPVTGETRKVATQAPANAGGKKKSGFPSPWSNDPLAEGDDYDEEEEDDDGPEEAGRQQYRGGPSSNSSSARRQPVVDNRKRDPITGAIIEDDIPAAADGYEGLDSGSYGRNNGSRRSLHDQYAERYNLGSSSAGASKTSLGSGKNKKRGANGGTAYGGGLPGEGDAGVRQGKKKNGGGIGAFFGGGKKGKKGGQQEQPESMNGYGGRGGRGDEYDGGYSQGRSNGSARAPAGGAFGNDDALDRELQGVSANNKRAPAANGYGNGHASYGYDAPRKAMPTSSNSNARRQDGYGERVQGDGLSHQF